MATKKIAKVSSRQDAHFNPKQSSKRHLWHLISPTAIPVKLATFLTNGMYFAKLSTFNDPLEGQLPQSGKNLLNKTFGPNQAQTALAQFQDFSDWSFASCWHESDGEPREEVWKYFGGNHTGIAIRSCPQMLTNAFPLHLLGGTKPVVLIGSVDYVDHYDPGQAVTIGNFLPTCFSVRMPYSHEQETRLLVCLRDTNVQVLPQLRYEGNPIVNVVKRPLGGVPHVKPLANNGDGLIIPINCNTLIDQIVIGRHALPATVGYVLQEVGRLQPRIQIVREI